MAKSTRSNDKTQCHFSTNESVYQRHIDEIARKYRELKLSDIIKKEKELDELPPKVSPVTDKEGEELQTNTERERDGERRGEQQKVKVEHDKPEASCKPKEEPCDGNLKELSAKKEQPTRQKVMELEGTLNKWEDTIESYKKFIAAISFNLALIDDRSLSSCIADIRKANDAIKEGMERKFANLESPASTKVNKEQEAKTAKDVQINEYQKMCNIGFDTEGGKYAITSITKLSDGKLVISGMAPKQETHITVINSEGVIQHKYHMEGRSNIADIPRYCCNFSEKKVLTVCGTQKVAIYDVSEGKQCMSNSAPCKPSNITKSTKPQEWKMTCVAYNLHEKTVIVCYGYAAALSIYSDQLECHFTQRLNNANIVKVNDIAVHPRFLLVCHSNGANTFTIKGKEIITGSELDKPDEANSAISVCVGKNSFIYMLWSGDKNITTLAQYSEDGLQLLLKKPLGKVRNGSLTTLDVDGTERLVIASNDPGILRSFQLKAE